MQYSKRYINPRKGQRMPVLTNISSKVLLQSKYKYQIFSQTYHVVFRHEMILSCLVEVTGNTQNNSSYQLLGMPNETGLKRSGDSWSQKIICKILILRWQIIQSHCTQNTAVFQPFLRLRCHIKIFAPFNVGNFLRYQISLQTDLA